MVSYIATFRRFSLASVTRFFSSALTHSKAQKASLPDSGYFSLFIAAEVGVVEVEVVIVDVEAEEVVFF